MKTRPPYPNVRGERETLARVLAGASLARYGDGEFKLIRQGTIKSQVYDPRLSTRLREILIASGSCMVGIPNINTPGPKSEFWNKYRETSVYLEPTRAYVSSFVTRPDSAPCVDTPEAWADLEQLWKGRDVTLVRGSKKSLTAEDLIGAGVVREIICPVQHAFAEYDAILERIGRPDRALLCLGPTATVLAVDLCARGVHAIDLGHIGMFLRKHRRGDPMWVTSEDKTPA